MPSSSTIAPDAGAHQPALIEESLRELPRGPLRVALSGGMDSTVLLYALARRLAAPGELERLSAHHLEHGLMPESSAWVEHCRAFAASLRVPFVCDRLHIPASGNIEQLAREARYARWAQVLGEDETLLLAHHAQDQAETLLMRLMRGGGGDLLKGMPRERALARGRLLRPFLHVPRSAIREYAEAHDLVWCEDPSNQALARDRNFVRHSVLPLLSGRWPQAVLSLANTSRALEREQEQLQALLEPWVEGVLAGGDGISADAVLALPSVAQLPVLRRALQRLGVHSLSEARLADMLRQLSSPRDRSVGFSLGQNRSIRRFAGRLVLHSTQPSCLAAPLLWRLDDDMKLAHGRLSARAGCALKGACLSENIRALEVRSACGGERLRVRGMTRKVARLYQQGGIAPWLRADRPLLFRDDSLVMVPGIAVDDAFARDRGWLVEWTPA